MRVFLLIRGLLIWSGIAAVQLSNGYAQTIPGGAEAGRVEQRFDETPSVSVKPQVVRGLESTTAPDEAAKYSLVVTNVTVVGSTIYEDEDLRPVYQDIEGQSVSLTQVFKVAAAITAKYRNDGYTLSRAIVPPQELEPSGAPIRIEIIEGYIEEVTWPEGLDRYRNFFDQYSAKITAQRPYNQITTQRYLLLANDLPGFDFDSTIAPSQTTPRASVLIIEIKEDDRFNGYLTANNHGVTASGPYQGTVGGSVNNALGIHERISAAFTAAGPSENEQQELLYFSWGYEQILNAEGLEFFFNGNAGYGDPGTETLLALGYKTESLNMSAGFSYPFILSRTESLFGSIAFDFKNSESFNLGVTATRDRLRIVRGSLAYQKADQWNGVNLAELALHQGIDGLGSTPNNNTLASRQGGVVDFFKVTAEASREQKLSNGFELFASLYGQWTDDVLLSSQECGYGGQLYGRGFDVSLITGDQCILASVELRRELPVRGAAAKWFSTAEPYAFVDYGQIWNIDAPAGTPAKDEGASAGLGLRLIKKQQNQKEKFQLNVAVSTVVVAPESQSDVSDIRGWFQTIFRF